MSRLVGLYLQQETILRDPGYLDALQEEIGLTHVIVAGPVRHSEATLALNPFGRGDRPDRLFELAVRRVDGSPLLYEGDTAEARAGRRSDILFGILFTDDDAPCRRAIALCRERGLAFWARAWGWTPERSML